MQVQGLREISSEAYTLRVRSTYTILVRPSCLCKKRGGGKKRRAPFHNSASATVVTSCLYGLSPSPPLLRPHPHPPSPTVPLGLPFMPHSPPPQEATFPSFLFFARWKDPRPSSSSSSLSMTLGLLLTGKDKLRASLSRSFRVLGGGWRRRDRARRSLIIPHLRTVFSSPSRSLNTYLADLRTSFFSL